MKQRQKNDKTKKPKLRYPVLVFHGLFTPLKNKYKGHISVNASQMLFFKEIKVSDERSGNQFWQRVYNTKN